MSMKRLKQLCRHLVNLLYLVLIIFNPSFLPLFAGALFIYFFVHDKAEKCVAIIGLALAGALITYFGINESLNRLPNAPFLVLMYAALISGISGFCLFCVLPVALALRKRPE